MVLPREFLLFVFLSLFSRCLLHNPSPPFIMEFFWVSRVPLFCSFANRACSVPVALVSPFAVFSHSFLLLVLIPSKASGRPSSLGRAEVCPSRHPHFWRIPLFPFFPIWAESCFAIFESHSLLFFFPVLVLRGPFAVCAMRGRSCFLFFSFPVFFPPICLILPLYLCLKGFGDPCFFSFCRGLFFFWDASSFSGLQDPLGLPFIPHGSSVPVTLGLAWILSFGLDLLFHFFWAYFIMTPF